MVEELSVEPPDRANQDTESGFTLIELMIVVVVIGILSAVAYPAYTDHMFKSRRSDAKTVLADIASKQQQYFADNKTYANTVAELGVPALSTKGYYNILMNGTGAVVSGGVTIYTGFTVTAQPIAAGPQGGDTKCTSLTITSSGKKTHSGTAAECW